MLLDWAQGLSFVPDVPHAVNVSYLTEGNGVGVSTEPPVAIKSTVMSSSLDDIIKPLVSAQTASSLRFEVNLTDSRIVTWETVLRDNKLYIQIPKGILPEGSKESFVTLLEYAEETLSCSHVIVYFERDRVDRGSLIKTFMFLGFEVVPPGNPLVPHLEHVVFMAYGIELDG